MRSDLFLFFICFIIILSCSHKLTQQKQAMLNDPSIDQCYKEAMIQKRIIPGMTFNMVESTLGHPSWVNYSSFNDGSKAEVWVYRPSFFKQRFSAIHGLSTRYLYIAFKEGTVVTVFNDIHIPNVIIIPRRK